MSNKKILIVEDHSSLRKALKEKLLSEKFQVLEAEDGVYGLNLAVKEEPDVILLDLLMPQMNGMEMLKKLRNDEWGKSVPVIILTNLEADDQLVIQVAEYEPAYYFVKAEMSLDRLVEKIDSLI